MIDLSRYDNSWYEPGRGKLTCVLWYVVNTLVVHSRLNPFNGLKIWFLRLFGAKIGQKVVIKPGVNIKYPWNLEIGSFSWIGENVWLDNLDLIQIGQNVCISQGAYLCSGNHNWSSRYFDLIVSPIIIHDGAWIGAGSLVGPGVVVGEFAVVKLGSVVTTAVDPKSIYGGNPCVKIKDRVFHDS